MRPVAIERERQQRQKSLKRKMYTWLEFGDCKKHPELNFTPKSIGEARRAEAKLKEVCSGCPVRLACLEHALTYPESTGIWGGLNPDERRRYGKR